MVGGFGTSIGGGEKENGRENRGPAVSKGSFLSGTSPGVQEGHFYTMAIGLTLSLYTTLTLCPFYTYLDISPYQRLYWYLPGLPRPD